MVKLLAVASGGGHWVQLRRLQPAFKGADVSWISTQPDYAKEAGKNFYSVKDASLWDKVALIKMFLQVAWLVIKIRPDVVITTGAAPGYAAIMFGRIFGARTIWLDSIANSETLSTSGLKAKRWAHVWLTQWEHLAHADGPEFWGAVI